MLARYHLEGKGTGLHDSTNHDDENENSQCRTSPAGHVGVSSVRLLSTSQSTHASKDPSGEAAPFPVGDTCSNMGDDIKKNADGGMGIDGILDSRDDRSAVAQANFLDASEALAIFGNFVLSGPVREKVRKAPLNLRVGLRAHICTGTGHSSRSSLVEPFKGSKVGFFMKAVKSTSEDERYPNHQSSDVQTLLVSHMDSTSVR